MTETPHTALVTGANRGIGLEVCRQLAQRGLRVILTSRSETQGSAAAAGLSDSGISVRTAQMVNALTVILAADLPSTIKVNAVCPGWVKTRMGGPGATRSVEDGAESIVWLATLPDDGPTAGFFRDRSPIQW